jgi:hypothetical protein
MPPNSRKRRDRRRREVDRSSPALSLDRIQNGHHIHVCTSSTAANMVRHLRRRLHRRPWATVPKVHEPCTFERGDVELQCTVVGKLAGAGSKHAHVVTRGDSVARSSSACRR